MAANTVLEPQSQFDKARFLDENIHKDILKFLRTEGKEGKYSPKQYIQQCGE